MKQNKRDLILCLLLGGAGAAAAMLGVCAKLGLWMPKQPDWYCMTAFCLSAAALLVILIELFLRSGSREGSPSPFARLLFSDILLKRSGAARIAYIGVTAALCIVSNMFEIKFATTQFSLTLFTSCLAGILLGPLPGGCAVLVGDALGYVVNSMGYPYYWWVALACASMAVISGLVMRVPWKFRGSLYVKLALISILTFLISSVGINTTGMYFIGLDLYFPSDVKDTVAEVFGGRFDFWVYFVIRFFLLGQIWNSLVNDFLLFLTVPALRSVKSLGLD